MNTATRSAGGAPAVFTMAIVLAACGGGSKTTTAAPATTTTTTARGAAAAAFTQCMKSHGVTLPAGTGAFGFGGGGGGRRGTGGSVPTGSSVPTSRSIPSTTLPPGVTEQQYQAARTACASTLPTRGNFADNPQFAAYYNCLNSYLGANGGTTLPPLSSGGGIPGLFGRGGAGGAGAAGGTTSPSTTENPMLAAAMTHCMALRPTFGAGGTTTSTTA